MITANIKIAAMRKVSKSIMLVAAAAMAFASCQKEENVAPGTISATLTMHANVEATKTYLGEDNTVLWGTGESVQLYVGVGETSKFESSASTDVYNGKASASFTFAIEGIDATGPYALGGVYPASAALDNTDPARFKVQLPATQQSLDGNYDPSAYIMVLKPETVDAIPTEHTASFRRATALNKITLTNVAEDVTSVEITVPEGKYLAGRRYFDLATGVSGEIYYDKSSTITVNSAFTGNSIDVWFCSWGVELAAGDELTVRMKSATNTYTRKITANENGIKFVEGDLNILKINMASATVETTDDFGGEWLITGTTGGVTYAAKAYSSGNNLSSPVQITVAEDGSITEVDGLDQCKMTFTRITEGDYEGMYTIKDAGGKYLYAASSSGNQMKGGASASSAHYYWTVECKNGAYSIVASKSSNRNVMQFNPNNNSPIFSCYGSASQTAVVLYPYSNVKPDTTPKIVVDSETTKNIGYEGGEVTFNYTLKNLDGQTLNVTVSDPEMLSTSADDGVLTVIVASNEGEARNATITLTCGEAEAILTIAQDMYEESGEDGGEKTITLTLNAATTGKSSSSYVSTATSFIYEGVTYNVNNWNPSSLQIRGNQTTQTNLQSGSNFMIRNTTAIPGKIKSIEITYTAGSVVAANTYAVVGASEITTQTTDGSTAGTAGTSAITWTFADGGSYFAIGMIKGGTSGTTKAGTITIAYEAN